MTRPLLPGAGPVDDMVTPLPFKVGLKLYSTNHADADNALALYRSGWFDYIELYTIPGSYEETIDIWRSLPVPYIVHAAHYMHGINFANAAWRRQNERHFGVARRFADRLDSPFIIIHGGNGGPVEEAIFQIAGLNEPRVAIENKPKRGLNGEECIGWSPEQFAQFESAGILTHMVLDVTHAACSSVSAGVPLLEWLDRFLRYRPVIYHLVDCDGVTETDQHQNLGNGDLPIAEILNLLPPHRRVTLETPRSVERGMADFKEDVRFLRTLHAGNGNRWGR